MITKIIKGSNFAGVLRYILNPEKQTELIDASGVLDSIIQSFERQQELNPRISKPVGHISLDFSAQDGDKLTNQTMVQIACDYMNRMGITDTQYIIGRHHDKDHPHIHIAYNHIDNNVTPSSTGTTVSVVRKSARNSLPNTAYTLPPAKKTSNNTACVNPTKPNRRSTTP